MADAPALRRALISAANVGVLGGSLLLSACGSSGNTITSPSTASKCSVNFDAPTTPLPATGGTGSVIVKTERDCQWSAQPDVGWLSITSGSSGQGEGAVQFNAAANGEPAARTGGIMLNTQRVQVTQAAAECQFELATPSGSFPQSGGSGSVNLKASSSLCTWSVTSDVPWIQVSTANGKGSASVAFSVASTTGPPRTGTLTIAGLRFSVTQSEGCTYAIAPSTYAAGASGGSSAVTVTSAPGCPWTASSNVNWVSIATTSGTASGTVGFTVAPTTGPSRTGTATIAGQLFTVTQSPGCTFDVSPLTDTVDASGGTRTVSVSAAAGCAWTASSNDSWITITQGGSGNGSGTISFSAAPTTGPSRSGTMTVAGKTVTIAQGQGCTFTITPDSQNVAPAGGTGSVTVGAGAGCAWTATSNAAWLTITSAASASGNGTLTFSAAATTGPGRSGTLTIAGRTFTVNQGQGCTFTLSAPSASAPPGGGNGTFDVRTADGCGWAAASNAGWLTVTGGATGSGNGTVHYTAAANTGPQRDGTITAGGQTFTVTQAVGCSYSISPASQNVNSAGGSASVSVTAPAGCSWSSSSNASWIGISSGNNGSGSGSVQLVIGANADAARSGTVSIAGQTSTINQASGCTYSISPSSATVPAAGGPGSFGVTTGGTCGWTAIANAAWVSITSGTSAGGSGTVQFVVSANPGAARSAIITTAGQTFTVSQESGCSTVVSPDTVPAAASGGSQSVSVSTAADCSWTAVSNAPWIGIPNGASGSGNGTVQLDIQPNTAPARSGTATVAGKTVTVNQADGCTFSIDPSAQPMPVGGGTGSVTVTAGAACPWTAVSNASWITVTNGANGSGGGTVQFIVDTNATGAPRNGTVTIAGQVFTVTQGGS